jgi:hypothetical protein
MTLFAASHTSVNGDVHPSTTEIASKALPHTQTYTSFLYFINAHTPLEHISKYIAPSQYAFRLSCGCKCQRGKKERSAVKICSSDAKKISSVGAKIFALKQLIYKNAKRVR